MTAPVDVLAVLQRQIDLALSYGNDERAEALQDVHAAVAKLIEAAAYAPLRMEDAVRAYEKAGDFLSADHVRKEVAILRAALARVGSAGGAQ